MADKCPFCERGKTWRERAWRLVRDLSQEELAELLRKKKHKKKKKEFEEERTILE